MDLPEFPSPDLQPVTMAARQELHGQLEKSMLQARRISLGEPRVTTLRAADLPNEDVAEFLRQEESNANFWLVNLVVSFYPEPKEPIDSAAIGLLLAHDGPVGSPQAIAWSIWPAKLSFPSNESSTLSVTANLGFIQPQISRTATRDHEHPFLLGLGEGQCDPEWRFRRSSGHEVEGIHHLAAVVRAPRKVQVKGAITVAASIRRTLSAVVRYRAELPPALASFSLPPQS
jgi:hypothetical protein